MIDRFSLGDRLRGRERAVLSEWSARRRSIEPLGFLERIELVGLPRRSRAPGRDGLSGKQVELLAALVGRPDGFVARDFEACLARSAPDTGIVGWAASDCTVALHRLQARGLVRPERVREGNVRLRWFLTPEGETATAISSPR